MIHYYYAIHALNYFLSHTSCVLVSRVCCGRIVKLEAFVSQRPTAVLCVVCYNYYLSCTTILTTYDTFIALRRIQTEDELGCTVYNCGEYHIYSRTGIQ